MIYLGADHGGFALKERLKQWLTAWSMPFEDLGAHQLDATDDYPDFAFAVAKAVAANPAEHQGIVLCRSAAGVVIAANKAKGVRAVAPLTVEAAEHARAHNNANVLGLSGDWLDDATAEQLTHVWLTTGFSGEERHQRRLDKIAAFEQQAKWFFETMITVLPAILEKDIQSIQRRVDSVVGLVSSVHLDIMDGDFVPNTTVNTPEALASIDWKGLAVSLHLMVKHPELYIRSWALPYVTSMVVHREAVNNMDSIIQLVHGADKQLSIALNPGTSSYELADYLDQIDQVMIMGVEPGFSAQGFNADVLEKIRLIHQQKPELPIAVDGGVNGSTRQMLVEAGATILCANSFLYKSDDIALAIKQLTGNN